MRRGLSDFPGCYLSVVAQAPLEVSFVTTGVARYQAMGLLWRCIQPRWDILPVFSRGRVTMSQLERGTSGHGSFRDAVHSFP